LCERLYLSNYSRSTIFFGVSLVNDNALQQREHNRTDRRDELMVHLFNGQAIRPRWADRHTDQEQAPKASSSVYYHNNNGNYTEDFYQIGLLL
jgi:hypothetical protein